LHEQLDMQHSLLGEITKSIRPREDRLALLLQRWDAGNPAPLVPTCEPLAGRVALTPGCQIGVTWTNSGNALAADGHQFVF
jgi:hypothetical protein